VPDDAPKLFALVEDLRNRLDAPRIHAIVVDPLANAGVLQQARFGPVGPWRNVLVIGMTLLRSISRDEMRGVLAHEIAHLERRHGRATAWIYRLRQAYPRLLDHLEHKGWTAVVAQSFFERYNPYFDLWSSALARTHEFEADRLAATIVGRGTFSAALVRIALLHRAIDERLEQSPDESDDEDAVDTHPSLARRLAALGAPSAERAPIDTTAAQELIPTDLDEELVDMFQLIDMFDEMEAALEKESAEAASH